MSMDSARLEFVVFQAPEPNAQDRRWNGWAGQAQVEYRETARGQDYVLGASTPPLPSALALCLEFFP